MNKVLISALVVVILLLGLAMPVSRPALSASDDVCPEENLSHGTNLGWHKVEGTSPSYNAPSGFTIDQVCVKGGQNKIFYNSNGTDGCWSISGIGGQSGSVTKVGTGSSCKDISHASFHITANTQVTNTPTPTSTPTPTVTDTPTPTPTDSQECRDCGGNQNPTPTPTDTPTPTVTNTPTPTPGSNNNIGGSTVTSSSTPSTEQKQGEVLGASTLAPTGNFASTIATIEEVAGAVIAIAGTLLYGNKKKTSKKSK